MEIFYSKKEIFFRDTLIPGATSALYLYCIIHDVFFRIEHTKKGEYYLIAYLIILVFFSLTWFALGFIELFFLYNEPAITISATGLIFRKRGRSTKTPISFSEIESMEAQSFRTAKGLWEHLILYKKDYAKITINCSQYAVRMTTIHAEISPHFPGIRLRQYPKPQPK